MSDVSNATWTSSMGKDIDKRNKINRENAKQKTQTVISSPNININCRVMMETGMWPANEYLQYCPMRLYRSIINSKKRAYSKQYSQIATQIQSSGSLLQPS